MCKSSLACLVGREAVPRGKHIWCLDNAVLAMNQENSFAAMAGHGLGLGRSPKGRSQELPSRGGDTLSCPPLTWCSRTCILGLNLSLLLHANPIKKKL